MKSIFTDKTKTPNELDLKGAVGNTYSLWQTIEDYVMAQYPQGSLEWNYSSYGWSLRVKDKKRVIIYLLPRDKFFKVAFVFGQKATDLILKSSVNDSIKEELNAAKVYAEGRGIRIEIKNKTLVNDIKKLIDIKLAH